MGAFIRHPKFWLPFLGLALLEGLFRIGAWEPLARPNSHAGTGVAAKRAIASFGPERIGAVTLGDSRSAFGIDHRRLLAESQADGGPAHVGLAMPGTHLTALDTVSAWVDRELPNLDEITVGVALGSLNRAVNGYHEIGILEPFRSPGRLRDPFARFPPVRGRPETWGGFSSLMAYREDIRELLQHPLERWESLQHHRSRRPHRVLGYRSKRDGDLCAWPLQTLDDCRQALDRVLADGEPEDPLAVAFRRNCRPATAPPPTDADAALAEWRAFLERTASHTRVTVVVLPQHSLLVGMQDAARPRSMLHDLAGRGIIDLVDLASAFRDAPEPECRYFSDLVHANVRGMERLTDQLIQSTSREIEP